MFAGIEIVNLMQLNVTTIRGKGGSWARTQFVAQMARCW